MDGVRIAIRLGLLLFAISTLWLVLSGTLGDRLDASRAERAARQAAEEASAGGQAAAGGDHLP